MGDSSHGCLESQPLPKHMPFNLYRVVFDAQATLGEKFIDKCSDTSNKLCGSPCASDLERWLPSPVLFGDLSTSPHVRCLTYIVRICTALGFTYCEISSCDANFNRV